MNQIISNAELRVEVAAHGAEVQSIKDVKSGQEYLWQGDARWWAGRSPLLFPIVGSLWNGTCRMEDGRQISLPKHGFLRRRDWRLAAQTDDSVRYEAVGTVGDFEVFPYAFAVAVTYRLNGRRLVAEMEVKNIGGTDLWFQMGGHPAIQLPDWKEEDETSGYLQLEGSLTHIWRAGEQGCLEPAKLPVPLDEAGRIALNVENFAHDALIFDANQVKAATVLDASARPVARVESSAPVWLFWSPAGKRSPFICCEPWYGLCDHQGFEGKVSERPHIQCAHSGETWQGFYSVEIL